MPFEVTKAKYSLSSFNFLTTTSFSFSVVGTAIESIISSVDAKTGFLKELEVNIELVVRDKSGSVKAAVVFLPSSRTEESLRLSAFVIFLSAVIFSLFSPAFSWCLEFLRQNKNWRHLRIEFDNDTYFLGNMVVSAKISVLKYENMILMMSKNTIL